MTTIAYLGPPGTFSEEAAIAYGGHGADFLPLASMPAAVTAVETGLANVCVLPIENVLEGSVTTTLDLLIHETSLRIVGETVIPIRHYLVTRPGLSLQQIKVLYGHPQSLGQCRKFVERCLPNVATIASLSNSADHPPTGDDKTSFCFGFGEEDRAGSLVAALQELAVAKINMTKLESRPSKEVLGRYIFLVDINGHRDEPHVAAALERLRACTGLMKIFGSYPRWKSLDDRR
jgi:prephenate dehydratase